MLCNTFGPKGNQLGHINSKRRCLSGEPSYRAHPRANGRGRLDRAEEGDHMKQSADHLVSTAWDQGVKDVLETEARGASRCGRTERVQRTVNFLDGRPLARDWRQRLTRWRSQSRAAGWRISAADSAAWGTGG